MTIRARSPTVSVARTSTVSLHLVARASSPETGPPGRARSIPRTARLASVLAVRTLAAAGCAVRALSAVRQTRGGGRLSFSGRSKTRGGAVSTTSITSYEEAVASHEWRVPERYNIAAGRLRQAPGRQARDDPRALRRHRSRGELGRVAGALQPLRQRAARAWRRAGRPGGDAAAADARDRGRVLRHLQVRRDPALDVGALRRRRHPPPRQRLAGQGARDQRGQQGPRRPVAGRPHPRARRRPAGLRRRELRARGHARRGPRAALLHVGHDRAGQGHHPRAPLPARARGVRLLPRRARRRALPRHGRVGVGGGHRAAARAVALRRRPARLPARGRLRPAQAAGLPLAP